MAETKIRFGTDGWRARIAEDFIISNVKIVCQAIADFLRTKKNFYSLVIGYDTRFFSEVFAEAAASVLTANGLQVLMPKRALPTPLTAFAIRLHRAAGAIMFTASHNPYYYHGIKFITEHAGPASPDITRTIEKNIHRLLANPSAIENKVVPSLIKEIDPFQDYLTHLESLVDFDLIKQNPVKVVVDPLFGAAYGLMEKVLKKAGCAVSAIHNKRDVFFGGKMPDPSEENLAELKSAVLKEKALAGLALDGDGDRFGLIDQFGNYFSPNQLLPIIAWHLLKNKKSSGNIVRTIATTHLLDKIAADHGVGLIETPVGFKYICQQMLKKEVMLGGEESGGLSIKGHIPEKDGLLANLLAVEAMACEKKPLNLILRELHKNYGEFQSARLDIELPQDKKAALLASLQNDPPREIAGQKVLGISQVDGIKFDLSQGDWALIRPSGTEPLIRVYLESTSPDRLKDLRIFAQQLFE